MIRRYRLHRARKALNAAIRAYESAQARGDKQTMGTVWPTLYAARHEVMRLELG